MQSGVKLSEVKIVLISISLIVFASAIYFGKVSKKVTSKVEVARENNIEKKEEVLSETKEEGPASETGSPQPSPTVASGSLDETLDASILGYAYPNAVVMTQSTTVLSLESKDSAENVTDWYETKIKAGGLNITTFVKTKTNDNVLNKLVGESSKQKVSVKIEKDSGDSLVKIEVELLQG